MGREWEGSIHCALFQPHFPARRFSHHRAKEVGDKVDKAIDEAKPEYGDKEYWEKVR